jgi:anti-sigma regulatory factor (Ser/Thr protein kinase)
MSDGRTRRVATGSSVASDDHGHIAHPTDARSYPVELSSLAGLRAAAAVEGRRYGLAGRPLNDLVLVANELATNAVRHGGGTGWMWLWCRDGCVYCQVSDHGDGMRDPIHAGERASSTNALTGRGLWLVRQMSDRLDIDSSNGGTTVTVAIPVHPVGGPTTDAGASHK